VPVLVLIVVFIVVPLAELYVILKVGDAIGVLPTLAILVADSLLGSWLLKSQGRAVWRRFNEAVQAGRVPHSEIIDGVLVIFGGAFLITPGFLTDIVGLLLLIPPTRAGFRRLTRRMIERGNPIIGVAGAAARSRSDSRSRPDASVYDVEGTATEVDTEPPRLPEPRTRER
jgi:UPF0716 protein FxsA